MRKNSILIVLILLVITINISFATLNQKKDTLQGEVKELEKDRKETIKSEREVKESIEIVLTRKATLITQIKKNELDIKKKKLELKRIQEELKKAIKEVQKQEKEFGVRLNAMYFHRNESFLEILFKSKSIRDFLNRVEIMNAIAKQDEKILKDLREKHENIKELKKIEEKNLSILEKLEKKLQDNKKALEKVEAELKRRAKELEAKRKKIEKEIRQKRSDLATVEASIQEAIRREQERVKKEQESGNAPPIVQSSGSWAWPVPSGGVVTSEFGMRMHPILGYRTGHNGLDIAAPTGTSIVAVRDGIVTKAAWYGGYGKCVIVVHDNGVATYYAHCSSLSVSEGQRVKKGQEVAKMGSTGISTGSHLHIGFYVNGGWQNPRNYIGN